MIISAILDVLFPKRCVGCGRIGDYFCGSCAKSIQVIGEREAICPMCGRLSLDGRRHPNCLTLYSIDGLTSFFRYRGVVKKGIKAIKYRLISDLVASFVDLVPGENIEKLGNSFHRHASHNLEREGRDMGPILVPIPLHSSRLRNRGFNQANLLGIQISRRLGFPSPSDVLVRTRQTIPQVEMKDRSERLRNMANVFAMRPNAHLHSPNIILVDDVFTTGATMRSAAHTLKRAGAKLVWALTMAR